MVGGHFAVLLCEFCAVCALGGNSGVFERVWVLVFVLHVCLQGVLFVHIAITTPTTHTHLDAANGAAITPQQQRIEQLGIDKR